MDTLKDKLQEYILTEQMESMMKEKERAVNKSNSRVTAVVTFCILLVIGLSMLKTTTQYYTRNSYYLMFAAAIVMGLGLHICLIGKYNKRCHKYIIVFSTAIAAAMIYIAIGRDGMVFFVNPLILSGRYGSRKVCAVTYLASLIMNCSAGVIRLHTNTMYYQDLMWIGGTGDIMLAIILPLIMMTTVLAFIVYGMIASDKRSIEQILKAREETAKVEAEFRTGAELQMSSLPEDFSLAPSGEFSLHAKIIPSKETSGDFYDFFMAGDGRAAFVIGDVSDKGVSAALYMMSARNTVRALCSVMNDPARIMTEANRLLLETSDKAFVTMFIAFVDLETGAGEYVNAGHDSPVICHGNGACGFLDTDPQPIAGAFDFVEYKSSPMQMYEGDVLLLYTDGINEAISSSDEEFGVNRLCNLMRHNYRKSPEEICAEIEIQISRFSDSSKHSDDRTMLAMKWEKKTEALRRMTMPVTEESITEMIDTVNAALRSGDCPEFITRNIDVVIDEIGANLVEHSGADTLIFEYECGQGHIRMTFTDNGIKFNPEYSRVYETKDPLVPGGLGIHFIRNLMDEVSYGYENEHNVYSIAKYWK